MGTRRICLKHFGMADVTRRWYETKKSVDRHDRTGLREGEQYLLNKDLSGKVLDLGCGTGRFTPNLANGVGID
jgi:ubiquinone/menaquinone biosynthesis C-methylase UbiE